jgi:hypothetical protein
MPQYDFACDCGHEQSVIWPMSRSRELLDCGVYHFNTPADSYSRPIASDSLAINPEQIPEHRKQFPDVEVLPDGRPVFDNFAKHDAYLKKTGFRKKRQKLKPKGERIV